MEYSDVYYQAADIVKKADNIRKAFSELEELYANVTRVENSREFSVLTAGVKIMITEKDEDAFKRFAQSTAESFYYKIKVKEKEIDGMINNDSVMYK